MLLTDELVIIASDGPPDGDIYAFDQRTGKVRWKRPVGRGATSDIVRDGKRIYAVTLDDELLSLDIETGELKWKYASAWKKERHLFSSTPAVSGDTVYFGGRDGTVYALNRLNGKLRWKTAIGDRVSTSIAVANGVIAGTNDGALVRLNRATGVVEKRLSLGGPAYGPIVQVADGLLLFVNWLHPGTALIKVKSTLERPTWRLTAPKPHRWISARPFVLDELVYLGTEGGGVHSARLADGVQRKIASLDGDIRVFGQANGVLYVGTIGGVIFACALP